AWNRLGWSGWKLVAWNSDGNDRRTFSSSITKLLLLSVKFRQPKRGGGIKCRALVALRGQCRLAFGFGNETRLQPLPYHLGQLLLRLGDGDDLLLEDVRRLQAALLQRFGDLIVVRVPLTDAATFDQFPA